MYTPTANREEDPVTLRAFMREHPFCALVTMTANGLVASHVPVVLQEAESGFGVLRSHVARGNAQWRDFDPAVEAMAIFTGPQHYISANWYPGKRTHGEEVPTWNYIAVHAFGRLRAIDDPQWLLEHVSSLTEQSATISPVPWKVSDAPPDFISKQTRAIVGLGLEISHVQGRWKASQNRDDEEVASVTAALGEIGTTASQEMSDLIQERRPYPGRPADLLRGSDVKSQPDHARTRRSPLLAGESRIVFEFVCHSTRKKDGEQISRRVQYDGQSAE